MSWTTGTFVAMAGFFAGNLLFVSLVRWFALGFEAWSQEKRKGMPPAPSRVARNVAAQSLFHSGPWLAVAMGWFGYSVRSEPWAEWFFWGFGVAFLLMTWISAIFAHQLKRRRAGRSPRPEGR